MTTEPVPQRIGDAERDRAVDALREHLAAGRLDQAEFDERLTGALTAKTSADLDPLFDDLPGPRPTGEMVPVQDFQPPPWQRAAPAMSVEPSPSASAVARPESSVGTALTVLTAVAWPATILLITFVLGWTNFWWLVFIPMMISSAMGKSHHDREKERRRIDRDQRRLDQRRRALGD